MKFNSLGTVQSTRLVSCLKGTSDLSVRNHKMQSPWQVYGRRVSVKFVAQALLVSGFIASSAAHAVTVDAWLLGTSTRILDTNGSNPDTSVQTTAGILGG